MLDNEGNIRVKFHMGGGPRKMFARGPLNIKDGPAFNVFQHFVDRGTGSNVVCASKEIMMSSSHEEQSDPI